MIFEQTQIRPKDKLDGFDRSIGEELLTPTRIYTPLLLELIKKFKIKAMAHITGGGIPENLSRVIPPKRQAVIELNSWPIPKIFRLIQRLGEVDHE